MRKYLLGLLSLLFVSLQSSAVIKVACIGASITYGATIKDREHFSYPAQLQKLLGESYQVSNYGISSRTLLSKGDFPYIQTKEYQAALKSNPDIVFIDLGGNDSKLINRRYLGDFDQDYKELIKSFASLPSHPRIILMLPFVSFVSDTSGIWDPVLVKKVIPLTQKVAFDTGLEVLDMHSLLVQKPELVPDKIHPNAEGSALIAKKLYAVTVQKRDLGFNIFNAIKAPQKIQAFHGYSSIDFMLNGRNCKVVKPKWSAAGHPWIWRARFWGHEPQADIALLERGFHVVYCDVAELFGNAEAVSAWNGLYSMVRKAGLSKKVALEGMSRGAVYVYNWAAANPEKVACVYVDNPVLDLKSWPAGLGKVPVSPTEFALFKKDYNLTSDEQVKAFAGSPIDKVKQIVKGKYPNLILCADADEAVPPEENTLLFEQKIKDLKGNITVLHKPGAKHHPHSLPDPSAIVDFILQATGY